MQSRRDRLSAPAPEGSVDDIVPARAVLTELARGFLLVHEADPDRAKRFAQTFLREQAGPKGPTPPAPPGRFAMTRRAGTGASPDPAWPGP